MKTERIKTIATYMEKHQQNRVMYECANMMMPKQADNFNLIDASGQRQMRPEMNLRTVSDNYEKQFNRETDEEIPKRRGEPRPLEKQISRQEIVEAVKKLKNNKATGPDDIQGELYKYGRDELVNILQVLFLEYIYSIHVAITDIGAGYLFSLNKPEKPKKVENVRPVTLLNGMRKILSNVVLARIEDTVSKCLPAHQHAARKKRSTSEVTWTIQTLRATVGRYAESYTCP